MQTLLKKLKNSNIKLNVLGDKLDINAPKGAMTQELLEEIKKNKDSIIQFIKASQNSGENHKSILNIEEQDSYVISSAQKRLWLLSQMEGHNATYNIPIVFEIHGNLNIKTLENSFKALIERHESLRTVFIETENVEIKQKINDISAIEFQLQVEDLSIIEDAEHNLNEIIQTAFNYPFDLSKDSLIRAKIIKTSDQTFIFTLVIHHIISDAWSIQLMINELFVIYNALLKNIPNPLEPLRIQYKEFANWQQEQLKAEDNISHKEYWLKQFEGNIPTLDLPTYNVRPTRKTFNGNSISSILDVEVLKKVTDLCQSHDSTLFMGLLSVLNALLYRYTNQNDIIIGTPIAGREHSDLQNQIGLYINTLALRTKFDGNDSFNSLLSKVRNITLGAYSNQIYPFDELIESLNLKRDLSRNPLFDIMLSLQNTDNLDRKSHSVEEIEIRQYKHKENVLSKFDLALTFSESESGLHLNLTYNTDLYTAEFVGKLMEHFQNLLARIAEEPSTSISNLDYLSEEDKKQIVIDFNNNAVDYPKNKTLIDLFEKQVEETPDNTAVAFEGIELTYRELNEITNQLGSYLRKNYTIIPEDFVGIKLERSQNTIIAILGILKAGAAYIPIDTSYPPERIQYIEEDSKCKLVIDENEIGLFYNSKEDYPISNIEKVNDSNNLAYVIYTSGTTGNPKGVMIEHWTVINLIKSQSREFKISSDERILQLSNFSFDASVEQTFLALLNGASLYILPRKTLLDENELNEFVYKNKITHFHSVPSIVSKLKPNKELSLKRVLSGGDICSEKLAESWNGICDFYNKYGPTETTVTCIEFLYQKDKTFCIGKPISNTQVYILDDNLQVVGVGVTGKIYISGSGVSRGYLNREDLTKEKFIDNPFIAESRMYDTGDLGRWFSDGTIDFLGRNDHQVKIRGFRIELGEIESAILQYSGDLKQVVVQDREVNGEKVLVAYYVSDGEVDKSDIRRFLQGKLPEYMVPSFYISLETLPLTPNGKTDRKALPGVSGDDIIRKTYVAPKNASQEKMAEIWQEVLAVDQVGITDNFFELGGNSLVVAQVINRFNKQLGQTISFKKFFSNPTIEGLSLELSQNEYATITQAPLQQSYALTTSQYRLWILSQLEGGSLAYNMPLAIKLTGDLDILKFQQTLALLIERHEILRTGFKSNAAGEIQQYITAFSEVEFSITEEDFSSHSHQQTAVENYIEAQKNIAFNLEQGPLIRSSLIRLNEQEHVFFLSMHHIIGDGWSLQLLVSEVVKIYNSLLQEKPLDLPALNIHYKDYAFWLNHNKEQQRYQQSEAFWTKQFEGALPVLELPSFKKRPLVQTYNGDSKSYNFPSAFSEQLNDFSRKNEATLFMSLMAGVKTLLHKYSGQDDIILGTPIAGRDHPDLENQIGLYLNTLAIRTKFDPSQDFLAVLNQEKQTLLEAYEHQEYSFDELIGHLNLKRDLSRSALFDVMIVLQNQSQLKSLSTDEELMNLRVEGFDFENKTSKFDLVFTFVESDAEGLTLNIQYNTDIYDSPFIEGIFTHIKTLYETVFTNPEQPINRLDYLSASEKENILLDFNATSIEHPKGKTIVALFEEQVKRTPDAIALVFEDTEYTYDELNQQSNQLAAYLRNSRRIEPNDLIAVKLERSEKIIISLLGILKTGAAYVPIDLNYPQQRIDYIEQDTQCKTILDATTYDHFIDTRKNYESDNVPGLSTAKDLAYIIYTSGTTGNPKGVMIEHRNAVELIHWAQQEFDASKFEVTYAATSYCFDLSVYEIFFTLSVGKRIRLLRNGLEIKNYIDKEEGILINTVPSVVSQLLEDGTSLDSVSILNMAGEIIPPHLAERLPLAEMEVYNLYGPSEDTTYSTYFKITPQKYASIPIGKPISNTQVYILDDNLQVVGVGVTGKIYISGSGVSRGYLNREDLTKEKFIDNPFIAESRMYDTGDLGRWFSDGTIDFLGRNDHQVKIRGFRIELGEIESAILQYSGDLKQVVVQDREVNGEKVLVAYYVSDGEVDKSDIRRFLQGKLPEYMVPSFYISLETLPLTPNGKTDRKALPGVSGDDIIRKAYVAPKNASQEKMAEIWQEVLAVDQVGITDNFFELGGNSLVVAQVINRFNKQLGQTISFKKFFSNPTIEGLSLELSQNEYATITQAPLQQSYALTTSQYRLWILSQLEGGSLAYNMPLAIKLTGDLDILKFQQTLALLIERHEILRTGFKSNAAGEIQQYITAFSEVEFSITEEDFSSHSHQQTAVENYIEAQKNIAFNLEQGPLIRSSLIRLNEQEHVFFLSMHHIIGDGWSLQLLVSEVVKIYNSLLQEKPLDLPALNIHYKDYAFWLNHNKEQQRYQQSEAFWTKQFEGALPVLELPSFKKRPLVQTYNGDSKSYNFPSAFSEQLNDFSRKNEATLFMSLMAGVKTLLHKYSGQDDIILGTPIAGRDHPDLENQIGLYLNTLAIRTKFDPSQDFLAVLNQEKQTLLEAYEHQEYSFDELIGHLNLKRDLSRSALFDVMIVLQNQSQLKSLSTDEELMNLRVEGFDFENKTSKFDLVFTFVESDAEGLTLNIQYNTDIYDSPFIEGIFTHIKTLYETVFTNPEQPINRLDYLSASEKENILLDFNATSIEHPKGKTIVALFEEQVKRTPDAIALVFEDTEYTYDELNQQSNQLAAYLRNSRRIEPNDLIAVKLERSEKIIISLLGILKTGAAYVPIDLNYPQQRIDYIEQDTQCKTILDATTYDHFIDTRKNYESDNVPGLSTAKDLAYIIYTSGTTGNPKGVMIEHRNAVELIHWAQQEFDASKFEVTYAATSYCFDLSVYEIFFTLSVGKRIRLLRNGLEIKNYIDKEEGILINTVPSVVTQLLEEGTSLDSVSILNMAGEIIPPHLAERLPLAEMEVYNLYGPSEDTTYSTYFKITPQKYASIPIGKPISNTQVYILDDNLQVVGVGVTGKIYISGSGVSRGYLNREDLTKEKFIDNPFIAESRMYDTGDLGRWMTDGTIDFLGRNDHQVKIRGFRIELGEIESAILQYSGDLKQVVVQDREVNGEKVLVAYYVSDGEVDKSDIRRFLQGKLPEYMVPSFYISLETLPLTPNGKTDRKALPSVSGDDIIRKTYVAPKNASQEKMAEIWQEVLAVDQVGITDNFFELGGNSISAINATARMNKEFSTNYQADLIFHHNTIDQITKNHINHIFDSEKEYYQYGNDKSQNLVFAFPPIAGYGSAYMDLFHGFEDCNIISFNFIENKMNLASYYAEKINEIQKEGDILLFGWSAGGNLSYEVADYLIRHFDRNVSEIIMLDSIILNEKNLNQEILVDVFKEADFEINENMKEVLKKAQEKQMSYISHLKEIKYTNQLSAQLTIINTEANKNNNWENLFAETIYVAGKGEHYNMLENDNLKYNKELLKKIFEKQLVKENILEAEKF